MRQCENEDFLCYVGWREPPLGTGESAYIVIPPKGERLTERQLQALLVPLQVSSFSEETIHFTVELG